MALGLLAQGIYANVLDVYGVVTSASPSSNAYFKVGDGVKISARYQSQDGVVTELYMTVNNSVLNAIRAGGAPGNLLTIDENAADGTVQWRMVTGHGSTFDIASNTPGGVIPCIDSFDLGRTFQIVVGNIIVNGTVVAKPQNRTGN